MWKSQFLFDFLSRAAVDINKRKMSIIIVAQLALLFICCRGIRFYVVDD